MKEQEQELVTSVRTAVWALHELLQKLQKFHKDETGTVLRLQGAIDGLLNVQMALLKDLN